MTLDTDLTHCDGCQSDEWRKPCAEQAPRKRCAMLGPDGAYTLALCADCYAPYAEQERERSLALSDYSDTFKDNHGFRPRFEWMKRADAAQLQKAADDEYAYYQRERAAEQAERAFDEALEANVALGGEGWAYTPAGGAA